jgi:hypothetical protein
MGYDGTGFSAAIVTMAYKGHLRIEQDNDQFVIVQETGATQPLSADEAAIAETLFAEKPDVRGGGGSSGGGGGGGGW